jgi:hypothetical protein
MAVEYSVRDDSKEAVTASSTSEDSKRDDSEEAVTASSTSSVSPSSLGSNRYPSASDALINDSMPSIGSRESSAWQKMVSTRGAERFHFGQYIGREFDWVHNNDCHYAKWHGWAGLVERISFAKGMLSINANAVQSSHGQMHYRTIA